jgi:Pyruvate/2-oxoacid:ferredoxin oxidoreductase delta subunit
MFCGPHSCTPVLQQAWGSRVGSRQKCHAATDTTTLQSKLSARPNFKGKNKTRCANCSAFCPICKTMVWKYVMELHYSTKHAGIDLPTHFMIGPLERAAMGKIKLLDAAAVPA